MSSIGYARVSSYGQSLEVQLEKLSFCDTVFHEKQSARNDDRDQLQRCLNSLNDGDSLVITKLDRLARSCRDILNIMERLNSINVTLVVLDQQIDTSTSTGMLLFTMLGAIATFENDLRRDRQSQGVEHAIRRGVKFGRKCVLNDEQLMTMKSRRLNGDSIHDLMNQFKVSRATVYRCLSQVQH